MTNSLTNQLVYSKTPNSCSSFKLCIGIPSLFILLFCSLGCTRDRDNRTDYNVVDSAHQYLINLSYKEEVSTSELIDLVREWADLDSLMQTCLCENSINNCDTVFDNIRVNVMAEIERLTDTQPRNLADYFKVISSLNNLKIDSSYTFIQSIREIYDNSDYLTGFKCSRREILHCYEQFLSNALKNGFSSKEDFLCFLKAEDKMFRAFLEHLSGLENIQLSSLRDNTSHLIKNMISLADEKKGFFTYDELHIILSIRNSYRVIQNANQCLKDLENGKVKSAEQSSAYLWMLLQPWMTIDDVSFPLLGKSYIESLQTLAEDTPKYFSQLNSESFPLDLDILPATMIKTYIMTKYNY